ncbi:hypothetical protein NL676_008471 [Syzygium grande]|nr:hypothetical protein NL676_008471 [Syzygium grande]
MLRARPLLPHLRTRGRQLPSLLRLLPRVALSPLLSPSYISRFPFLVLRDIPRGLTMESHSHGRVATTTVRSGGDARRLWPRCSSTPSLNRKIHGQRCVAQRRRPWLRLRLSITGRG